MKYTTKDFVNKAVSIHGDKYDYSHVRYINSNTKVEIICPIHGSFWQTPNMHIGMKHQGCPMCGGTKRMTIEEFVKKARNIHGNRYDYSLAVYKNNKTKVELICQEHGVFAITPNAHLRGDGCPLCWEKKRRRGVFGVGRYDYYLPMDSDPIITESYTQWRTMLGRCYSSYVQSMQPNYVGCTVCDEWHSFSNFFRWFRTNYRKGYYLDKDILVPGNKIYSPETCCLVPNEINTQFSYKRKKRNLPIGVIYIKHMGKYAARINHNGKDKYLCFTDNIKVAFEIYKETKRLVIQSIAERWRGNIDEKVYERMMQYRLEDYVPKEYLV